MLFVLCFDCNRHAFAIVYNDAVMQIKQFITYYFTATATATATQGRSYLYARYARAYLKKSRVKKNDIIKWDSKVDNEKKKIR